MPLKLQFIPVPAADLNSNRLCLFNRIAAMAMAIFTCATPGLAQTTQSPPGYSSLEMAATLRDMITLERIARNFRVQMFILPSDLENAFKPQSAWGREQQQDYENRWNEALGTLLSGLRRRGELADALSPNGLRLPVEKSFFEDVPEYMALDKLLHNVDADICEQESSPPNCYIVIHLNALTDQRIALQNLRIVAPDGSLIPIPGKVQQP